MLYAIDISKNIDIYSVNMLRMSINYFLSYSGIYLSYDGEYIYKISARSCISACNVVTL